MKFKTLFLLESPEHLVFEIKRQDIETNDPSKKFFWFHFLKQTGTLKRLKFVSMSSENGQQQRVFEGTELSFNDEIGSFILQNEDKIALVVNKEKMLSNELANQVKKFLNHEAYTS